MFVITGYYGNLLKRNLMKPIHNVRENSPEAPYQLEPSPECNRDDSFGKCAFSPSSTHPRQYHKCVISSTPSPNFKPMLLAHVSALS
ncbi:unnamed protein product, partial [Timema podura]|nr:unnamed protein product [Timema podura]